MRLRSVDLFRATQIHLPSTGMAEPAENRPKADLAVVACIADLIAKAGDVGGIIDGLLDGMRRKLGFETTIVLLQDHPRDVLATVGSRGYGRQGVGSEVPFGQGVIGRAASDRRPVKVNDLSRIRRFAGAIRSSSREEDRTVEIPLPGLPGSASQNRGSTLGSWRAACRARGRKPAPDGLWEEEIALTLLAQQAAVCLALLEKSAAEPAEPTAPELEAVPARSF